MEAFLFYCYIFNHLPEKYLTLPILLYTIMWYRSGYGVNIVNGVTTVECQKQVQSWRLLRSLLKLLIPSCNNNHVQEQKNKEDYYFTSHRYSQPATFIFSRTTITVTMFGYRRAKVRLCIQDDSKTTNPILLLELAVSTCFLAKEMQSGVVRIALERHFDAKNSSCSSSLLSAPMWTMYCNGRKSGFAMKRRPTQVDMSLLRLLRFVTASAGIISGKELNCEDELLYLRANFERVSGLSDSESFHLINPDGITGQELSIFFLRSG